MLWIKEKKDGHGEDQKVGVEEDEDASMIETPAAFEAARGFDHAPEGHEGGEDLPVGGVQCIDVGESAKAQADGESGQAEENAARQRLLPQSEDGQARPHEISLYRNWGDDVGRRSGQSHEGHLDVTFAVLRRPYGADCFLLAFFPTLKRGANEPCASGASEIATGLVNEMDSVIDLHWGRE